MSARQFLESKAIPVTKFPLPTHTCYSADASIHSTIFLWICLPPYCFLQWHLTIVFPTLYWPTSRSLMLVALHLLTVCLCVSQYMTSAKGWRLGYLAPLKPTAFPFNFWYNPLVHGGRQPHVPSTVSCQLSDSNFFLNCFSVGEKLPFVTVSVHLFLSITNLNRLNRLMEEITRQLYMSRMWYHVEEYTRSSQ